ncbi:MAG: SPFH domain-containing protein [Anaerolineae bacterium]
MRIALLALGVLLLLLALVLVFAEPLMAAPTVGLGVALIVAACVRRVPEGYCILAEHWDGNVELYRGPIAVMVPGYARSISLFWEGTRLAPVEAQGLTSNHVPITVSSTILYSVNLDGVAPRFKILAATWPDATWRQTIQAIFSSLVKEIIPQLRILPPDYVCDRAQFMAIIEPRLRNAVAGMGVTIELVRPGEMALPPEWLQPMQERVQKVVNWDSWLVLVRELQTILRGLSPDEAHMLTQIIVALRSVDSHQPMPLTDLLATGMIGNDRVNPALMQALSQMVANNGNGGNSAGGNGSGATAPSSTGATAQTAPPSPSASAASPASSGSTAAPMPSSTGYASNGTRPAASAAPNGSNGATPYTATPTARNDSLAVPPNGTGRNGSGGK